MSPEKIGYVLKMYPRFSETFIVSELLGREALGADVEILSLRPPVDPRFHSALARVQAPVTYVPRPRRADDVWGALRAAAPLLPRLPQVLPELLRADTSDAVQALDVAGHVVRRGITHLHAHFASMATTVARLASRLTGVPYSFTAHAKDIFHESVDPVDLARKITDAHHVVTISDYNRRHLEDTYPTAVAATRLHRIYNGIDLDAFEFTAPQDRVPREVLTVVAVGRLVEKKGFDVLVDAVADLHHSGRRVRCRIIGGGEREAALREQVTRLGLTGVVELTGPLPQDDVRTQVARADVFAAPCVVGCDGNADGLPTVLLEAMALGTPCVSTDVTGITEAVRDEVTGLEVPQRDAAALAAAIDRLRCDGPLRDRLARAARDLVEDRFDTRRQVAELARALAAPRTSPRRDAPQVRDSAPHRTSTRAPDGRAADATTPAEVWL